jgi:hypothetical protein
MATLALRTAPARSPSPCPKQRQVSRPAAPTALTQEFSAMAMKPFAVDQRQRELRQRSYLAVPTLREQFPAIEEVAIELRFTDPDRKMYLSPYKRIFASSMQAFFDFQCPDSRMHRRRFQPDRGNHQGDEQKQRAAYRHAELQRQARPRRSRQSLRTRAAVPRRSGREASRRQLSRRATRGHSKSVPLLFRFIRASNPRAITTGLYS